MVGVSEFPALPTICVEYNQAFGMAGVGGRVAAPDEPNSPVLDP
jgi:hypothetical protein